VVNGPDDLKHHLDERHQAEQYPDALQELDGSAAFCPVFSELSDHAILSVQVIAPIFRLSLQLPQFLFDRLVACSVCHVATFFGFEANL
jgi:hypothetical protein